MMKGMFNKCSSMTVTVTPPIMLRCPELSKLPKATGLKSVNFRRQTPGSPVNLLSPRPSRENIIDSTHPSSNASFNSFPSFRSNELGIRAYPMALLDKPEVMWQIQSRPFDSWNDRVVRAKQANELAESEGDFQTLAPMILNNPRQHRVPMSFLGVNKKRTIGKRHIRATIMKKIKTAINLIVVRGADTTELKGRPALVFNQHADKLDQTQWILQGWSYIFFPTLHIYRMSYHDLIPKLRSALGFISERGSVMEKRWAAQISLQDFKHALPPPRGVKGLDRAEVMDRRPLTDTRRSYKDMYGPVPTHTRQTNRGESFSAPADRTSRKAPALSSQKGVSAEPRTWRLALEGEANSDNEDWKDFDIDIQDSPTRYATSDQEKTFGEPRLLFPSRQQPNREDTQWPLAPASPNQASSEPWRYSDAPSVTTEAEDAWAQKYPTSVRDMAKRKLFRRRVVFRPPPEPKRSVQE